MPEPPHSTNFDNDAQLDRRQAQRPSSAGTSATPVRKDGYLSSTSDDPETRPTSSYDTSTDFAYRANPSSDTAYNNPAYASGSPNGSHHAGFLNGRTYDLASNLTNAELTPNLTYPNFDSQEWPATTGPYLYFAPQPSYEPTGELAREAVERLEHFDDPSYFRESTGTSEQPTVAAVPQSLAGPPRPTSASANTVKDVQALLKPALKRSLGSDHGLKTTRPGFESSPPSEDGNRKIRKVSFEQMSGAGPNSTDEEDSASSEESTTSRPMPSNCPSGSPRRGRSSGRNNAPTQRRSTQQSSSSANLSLGAAAKGSKTPTGHPPCILPPEKVFPIQIGSELFRLSGASISSDAPSYFTQFFEEQLRQNEESGGVRTLYIDRDPETFRDVARHLQGYYVKPRDGSHFVKLFADAQFYSLPRLIDQLFEAEIFIQIGERHFQIPKDIFSDPGNSPNFFSLGFAVFFSTPGEVFPGLDRRGLLRPPSITPPYVSGRSAETFAQLLHMLRGYPLHIRNETHRVELLRDCRYFHLRGLEQKIIAHDISYNLERQKHEISLRIEDIKPSGISYKADEAEDEPEMSGGWVKYARPFIDDTSYELIVEIGGETTMLDLKEMRLDLHGLSKARVSSLFQVVANKMNLPTNAPLGAMLMSGTEASAHASPAHTPLSEDRVKVRVEPSSDIILDGVHYDVDWSSALGQCMRNEPTGTADDEESSDAMGGGNTTRQQQLQRKSPPQPEGNRMLPSLRSRGIPQPVPSRIETMTGSSRKRRRPMAPVPSDTGEFGQWAIRCGQWRLRVQQGEGDLIHGGYEIVFIAVKIDAYSQERARNARRKFLGASD